MSTANDHGGDGQALAFERTRLLIERGQVAEAVRAHARLWESEADERQVLAAAEDAIEAQVAVGQRAETIAQIEAATRTGLGGTLAGWRIGVLTRLIERLRADLSETSEMLTYLRGVVAEELGSGPVNEESTAWQELAERSGEQAFLTEAVAVLEHLIAVSQKGART